MVDMVEYMIHQDNLQTIVLFFTQVNLRQSLNICF